MNVHFVKVTCTNLVVAMLLLTTGCATSNTEPTVSRSAAAKSGLVCKTETPTGSKRPVTTCRTVAQLEDERADAKERLKEGRATGQINNM